GRGRGTGRRGQRHPVAALRGGRGGGARRPAGTQAVVHRVDRGGSPAVGGRRAARGELLDGARRQCAVHRARRRRHRRGGRGRDGRQDAQRRGGLHRGQPPLCPRGGRGGVL